MKLFLRLILFGAGILAVLPVRADRETTDLLTGWKFIRRDVALTDPTTGWDDVTLPHTWNAVDGEGGLKAHSENKDGYYRGPAWYQRTLLPSPSWKSRRVFIRFEAASTVAQVYLNGKLLGEHCGGFTASCFELTNHLLFDSPNDLRVRVDNTERDDVSPLTGDFNVDGGLYRPVQLIVTDPVCISPLDSASPGVYLTTRLGSNGYVSVDVRTVVSSSLPQKMRMQLTAELRDANGKFVQSTDEFFYIEPGSMLPSPLQLFIQNPRYWAGCSDPYLYQMKVYLRGSGEHEDDVTQPLGIRTVTITNEQGFLLNGKPYPIHGVNLHQDMHGKGWAISDSDHDTDMKLMADMGVTAIRLAHYPQSDYVHNLADRTGILLWDELPIVNALRNGPAFKENASQQMREMILQLYNHPSVAFWGMFNEIGTVDDHFSDETLGELKHEQQQLDPTRLNVAASCNFNCEFDRIPDWICYNPYVGWYEGSVDGLSRYIDTRYQENGDKRIGISEYGAGANPTQHENGALTRPQPFGQFHPEEWQTYYHERAWAQIRDNPKLWGSFLWCMFDFASSRRNEGSMPGVNDKGLVTADRKIKKDAYYFYQANWTTAPMVHVNGHWNVDRRSPFANVDIYSNGPQVELMINGKSLGIRTPDDLHICRWPSVQLKPGNNFVKASIPGTDINDTCGWVYAP